ncbi:MAG: alpha/beta hydrolase [Hyphomicrobiales bacterium]
MDKSLPDLFPGFESHSIHTDLGPIFCRTGGIGPALLLLHGYPQSHVIWHRIAPDLAQNFTLVMPDLPGYGQSAIPSLSTDHEAYSKRSMANCMIAVMRSLGHDQFLLTGHDRGGRVAYRMALDHPETVLRLAVLDILPTYDYWNKLDRTFALKIYHWAFLAQAAPFPENLISAAPLQFLEHTLASWTAKKDLSCFSDGALAHTRAWFNDPGRIAASCEDYRAGAHIDYHHDENDLHMGNTLSMPCLALWGENGIATSVDDPLETWRRWCPLIQGKALPGGHFLPEETPEELQKSLASFFAG